MHASSSLQYPVDLQYIIIIISVLAMAAATAALRHVTIVLNGVRHAVYSVCVCQMMTCWRTRWRDITARCRWWLHHTQTTHVAVYLLTVQWCVCHAASWLINVNVQSSTQSLSLCVCVCVCVPAAHCSRLQLLTDSGHRPGCTISRQSAPRFTSSLSILDRTGHRHPRRLTDISLSSLHVYLTRTASIIHAAPSKHASSFFNYHQQNFTNNDDD